MQHLATQGRTGFIHSDLVRLRKVWHCSKWCSQAQGEVSRLQSSFLQSKHNTCKQRVGTVNAEIILCEELVTKNTCEGFVSEGISPRRCLAEIKRSSCTT